MKRLYFYFTIALLTGTADAGLITHSDYTSGTAITAAGQNTNENLIFNEFNGNINSANIVTGGISTANLADGLITTAKFNSAAIPTFSSGTVTTLNSSTATIANIHSVPNGNTPCAGCLGETTTCSQTIAAPSASVFTDACDLGNLTAGTWVITCQGRADIGTATWTEFLVGISTTTGNSSAGLVNGKSQLVNTWASSSTNPLVNSMSVSEVVTNSSTFDYLCKSRVAFSGGQPTESVYGFATRIN